MNDHIKLKFVDYIAQIICCLMIYAGRCGSTDLQGKTLM